MATSSLLLFVLILGTGMVTSESDVGWRAAPDDGGLLPFFEAIGKDAETYQMILLNLLNISVDINDVAVMRHELDDVVTSHYATSSATSEACGPKKSTCLGCKLVIGALRVVVRVFKLEYVDVQDALNIICTLLLRSQGHNARIICPNLLPNYGPHVVNIIKLSNAKLLETDEPCKFINACDGRSQIGQTEEEEVVEGSDVTQEKSSEHSDVIQDHSDVSGERPAEEDIYKVVQLADIHVDADYDEGSGVECNLMACCRKNYRGTGSASQFGEYSCNAPPRTVETWLQKVAEMKPDVLLYSGDTPPHHIWYERLDEHLNYTRGLAEAMQRNLPGIPVFPAIGNHDPFPSNMYYVPDADTQLLHDVLVSAYPGLSDESKANMHKGGYYVEELTPTLRLLTYNTNYGYQDNWYNILAYSESHYPAMKSFVHDTLQAAKHDGVKVILMGHHPVGFGIVLFDEWVTQICTRFHDVIALHIAGHKHTDLFKTMTPYPESWATSVQFAAPSANPLSRINPSMRLYEINRKTNQLVDFVQYRMDFSDIGSGAAPIISQVYRASEEYGLPDMSAKSWHKLAIKMLGDTELLNKYEDNFGTGVAINLHDSTCAKNDLSCHNARVCDLTSSDLHSNWRCCKEGVKIPRCVDDCAGMENGHYQSCNGCHVYVTCSNGYLHDNRPCPDNTVWDDVIKRCENTSSTCQ